MEQLVRGALDYCRVEQRYETFSLQIANTEQEHRTPISGSERNSVHPSFIEGRQNAAPMRSFNLCKAISRTHRQNSKRGRDATG
jgi:hypothetical protein